MNEPIFFEVQQVDRRVRNILLVLTIAMACSLIGANLLSFAIHFIFLMAGLLSAFGYVASATFKFTTRVYPDHLTIRFWPFFQADIARSDIAQLSLARSGVIGFGVRYDAMRGTAYYKAAGKKALRLTLKDRRTVVIGSQKAWELKAALGR